MKKNKTDLAQIDELEIEALTDQELEAVVSGAEASASCSCCAAGATVQTGPVKPGTTVETFNPGTIA